MIMSLINTIVYWMYGVEIPENKPAFDFEYYERSKHNMESTRYNPATGLPMVGSLDVSGNIIGTSRDSDYRGFCGRSDKNGRFRKTVILS
jgi:hypothetical protein